jgi:hypothetical protein
MKKFGRITEVEGEGLTSLLGQDVILFCLDRIYTGKLSGVSDSDVLLEDAEIANDSAHVVYQVVGRFTVKLPNAIYVRTSAIESYTILK